MQQLLLLTLVLVFVLVLLVLLVRRLIDSTLNRLESITSTVQENLSEVFNLTSSPKSTFLYPASAPDFRDILSDANMPILTSCIKSTINDYYNVSLQLPPYCKVVSRIFSSQGIGMSQRCSRALILDMGHFDVVAFRGTMDTQDFFSNFRAYQTQTRNCHGELVPGLVHSGFASAVDELLPQLNSEILRLYSSSSVHKPVVFTGHSLGGALAAISCIKALPKLDAQRCFLCTFGCPRFGDRLFFSNLDKVPNKRIVVNVSDMVPQFPSSVFVDVSGRYYYYFGHDLDLIDVQTGSLVQNHSIDGYEAQYAKSTKKRIW
jgi:predicted lipase